ncbi:prepilin-type N-terminal cleavage/methylation domain-containing protein [Geobacter sp.]|uniref:PilW family protein n=1 Tax=Geobacter sp. TaxID=46610 RepID=UPI0026128E69|nr:prepilin-type N-terminal cleavage/methylation domain-containing protein [Geobacter sp.]
MAAMRTKDTRGFTLVELLVVMVVAGLVTMAAVTTFIVQNKIANIQAASSDVQISGQIAMDLLERDIRMGGYGVDKATAITMQDNAGDTDPLKSTGTDAIQVRYSTAATPGIRGSRDFTYYVAKTGEGGLVRLDNLSGTTDVIASNVEDMQVTVTPDVPVTGAMQVVLSLMIRSAAKDPTYTTVPPRIGNGIGRDADGFRRRVYNSTINPRNYFGS